MTALSYPISPNNKLRACICDVFSLTVLAKKKQKATAAKGRGNADFTTLQIGSLRGEETQRSTLKLTFIKIQVLQPLFLCHLMFGGFI